MVELWLRTADLYGLHNRVRKLFEKKKKFQSIGGMQPANDKLNSYVLLNLYGLPCDWLSNRKISVYFVLIVLFLSLVSTLLSSCIPLFYFSSSVLLLSLIIF